MFLITTVIRLSFILLLSQYYNDPGDDGAIYIEGARSIKEGRGYVIDFIRRYNRYDGITNNKITHPGYWYPPIYPAFIAMIFCFKESLLMVALANAILSGVLIVLIFTFVTKLFNRKSGLLAAILIMVNPMIHRYSICILSEMLYVIFATLTFYLLAIKKEEQKLQYTIMAGFLASATFLTRYIGIFVILSGLIWLLINKKVRSSMIFAIVCLCITGSWFLLRNYILFNDPLVRFHSTGLRYPPAIVHVANIRSNVWKSFISNIWHIGRDMLSLAQTFSSIEFFWILLPFIMIGCFKYLRDRHLSLFIIFLFTVIIGHVLILKHSIPRYYIATIVFLTPIGLKAMDESLQHLISSCSTKIFNFLIIITIGTYLGGIIQYTHSIRKVPLYRDELKYKWLQEHASPQDIIASTEPQRCHYYMNLKSVLLPNNLDETWLDRFIDFYNISYITLNTRDMNFYAYDGYIRKVLYREAPIIKLQSHYLILSHKAVGKYNTVLFYKVMKHEQIDTLHYYFR